MFGNVFYKSIGIVIPQGNTNHNREFQNSNDKLLRGFNEMKKFELVRARALKAQGDQSLDMGFDDETKVIKQP